MIRTDARISLPAVYDAFLYTAICEEEYGMPLTVLSLLARRNVDPWQEAAALSRLPDVTAAGKLKAMIVESPGRALALLDASALAARLITLLPQRPAAALDPRVDLARGVSAITAPAGVKRLVMAAVYISLMILGQWLVGSLFTPPHSGAAGAAPSSSSVAPAPSPIPLH